MEMERGGNWEMGQKHGKGIFTLSDGVTITKGRWEDDELVQIGDDESTVQPQTCRGQQSTIDRPAFGFESKHENGYRRRIGPIGST